MIETTLWLVKNNTDLHPKFLVPASTLEEAVSTASSIVKGIKPDAIMYSVEKFGMILLSKPYDVP